MDLLQYNTSSVEIPLSLTYSSNGIQVDRLATKVGLGWNLNAGGVITRQVNHNPDEESGYIRPNSTDYNSQAWADYFYNMIYSIPGHAQPLAIDSQPDIFTFNFLGHQGRFTMDNSQNQRRIVPLDNITYDIVYVSSGDGSFKIIDPDGNTYYFEEIESTRSDRIGGTGETNFLGNYIDTAWYLTRVISVKNEIVYFDYLDEDYNYVSAQSQYVRLKTNIYQTHSDDVCGIPYPNPYQSPIINHNLLVKGKKLWKIRSDNPLNGTVEFSYDLTHSQVNGYDFLTGITLKNSNNSDVETIQLSYMNQNERYFLEGLDFDDPNKTYRFEYINLPGLPERLSKQKDHWGYFNNNANSKIYPDIDNVFGDRVRNHFGNGANKEIDTVKSKIGLLKKLIYPTKGYSEFEYESNSYNEQQEIVDYEKVYMEVATLDSQRSGGSQQLLITSQESEIVPLEIRLDPNYYGCSSTDFPAAADQKLSITIQNLTFNQSSIIKRNIPGLGIKPFGNSLGFNQGFSNDEWYFDLRADSQYKITIAVYYECLRGNLNFEYSSSASTYEFVNVKTGGQRISGYKNYSHSGELLDQKKYYYAKRTNLSRSTGLKGITPQYTTNSFASGSCTAYSASGQCAMWIQYFTTLNSGAIQALFNTDVQTIRYTDVIESSGGGNFENGGIQHTYKFARPNQPYQIFNALDPIFSEGDLSWGDGLETERVYFKKDGSLFKDVLKEQYFYVRDNRITDTVYGYPISLRYYKYCANYPSGSKELVPTELNVSRYYISQNWHYLSHKRVTNFDTENAPIVSNEYYYYDNPEHGQLSRIVKSSSSKKNILQRKLYPHDLNSSNPIGLDPFSLDETSSINQLIANHRIIEHLQSEVYVDDDNNGVFDSDELISAQRTNYKIDSGIVQPESVQTLKGLYNSTTNKLRDRIIYHDYDSYGNPLEVSKDEGSHISYLWGYSGEYLVAKIENATQAEVTTTGLNQAILTNPSSTNAQRTTELNKVRNGLPNAMVTTYEYEPLVGVTKITDPRGQEMTYEYDDFNRLKTVLDDEMKLLQEYKYHYKNQ
ncbi:RHS repeat protein [Leeuwenhoekiella aestuarii]|uniref:RHS repeat protein n=1 Tax=Leeuwenhoekiella aestuarii TaxID=2249426 RepID=UPI000FFF36AD|nr:RHS repeat protein [Leeuwenhoekiella aestuarii]